MTAIDPTYARRMMRAIEDALTRRYGREAALRMIREAERRAAGPSDEYRRLVEAGATKTPEMGDYTHADRHAAE